MQLCSTLVVCFLMKMSSYELSFRYMEAEALKILHEDYNTDDPDNAEKYVLKDEIQAYEIGSSDEDLCDSDDAGSFSCTDNDSDDGNPSSRQYTPRNDETWKPSVHANSSNLMQVASGVNPGVCYKASNSPYEC